MTDQPTHEPTLLEKALAAARKVPVTEVVRMTPKITSAPPLDLRASKQPTPENCTVCGRGGVPFACSTCELPKRPPPERNCGTCQHWKLNPRKFMHKNRCRWGCCDVPLPACIYECDRVVTEAKLDGKDCHYWEGKKKP